MEKKLIIRSSVWGLTGILALLLGFFAYMSLHDDSTLTFPRAEVTIEQANGKKIAFDMELATTKEQKAHGLMFRKSLPANEGMLFVWEHDQPINMWMKNTIIPLDMLFVRHDGAIVRIATHTRPYDLTSISSGEPVAEVIEINAGTADHLGIKIGDKVLFSAFSGTP